MGEINIGGFKQQVLGSKSKAQGEIQATNLGIWIIMQTFGDAIN